MISRSRSADAVLLDARATTRHHAHTFALATRLLPRDLRDDVYLLYLVCRTLDDLVDEHHADAGTRLSQVRRWAEGQPAAGREERILEGLFERHPQMPRDAIADFCEGQMFDLYPQPFENELQLDRYAYQVAGTVGRLMVAMLGPTSPNADASGRALGIAMQRTNILRDVDEDLANERVYLPRQTMRLARVHDLRTDDRRRLLRIEIAIAEDWYEQGIEVVHLVRRGQLAVQAAALMYREILRQLERQHFEGPRAVVSGWRKAALLAEALLHD
jgi:15-cis-phytoene synthase